MNIYAVGEIEFCAAHRLVGYEGKCSNLHGHNYKLITYVKRKQSLGELNDLGMVVDFSKLKSIFKGWIDRNWDHAFIYYLGKDSDLAKYLAEVQKFKVFGIPYNPTAENMARFLVSTFTLGSRSLVSEEFELVKIRLYETSTSFVEVTV